MHLTTDISTKIEADFKKSTADVLICLKGAISQYDYLNSPRIIRCIVFLANGDLDKLKLFIQMAITDPRDVMLNAEYEMTEANKNTTQKRDFTQPFGKTEIKT